MISRLIQRMNFSTTEAITKRTFSKFQERYAAHAAALKEKTSLAFKDSGDVKKITTKIYQHPFIDEHKTISVGGLRLLETRSEMIGVQQVSPHYEHFSFARRHMLTFWVGFLAMRFIAQTPDFYMFAQSGLKAWMFTFSYLYFFSEGRKFFLMPFLNRFYRRIAVMEMTNVDTYFAENMEVRIRNLMGVAKAQLDFKLLHNEYEGIRNSLLLSFLINEQVSIKNHLYERAENILRQAEQIERSNEARIIADVMSETLKSIDQAFNENRVKIEADFFDLALDGIAKGRMDYAKDPILPYVVATINKTVKKFEAITPADQEKMISLNEEQLAIVRANDARVRDEFINQDPKIEGSLRTSPVVAKIMESWGK